MEFWINDLIREKDKKMKMEMEMEKLEGGNRSRLLDPLAFPFPSPNPWPNIALVSQSKHLGGFVLLDFRHVYCNLAKCLQFYGCWKCRKKQIVAYTLQTKLK